jgi:DNA-binding response OmpR family regulator
MNSVQLLLVEDDPNLGQLLKEYLEVKGFSVKLCRNGEEGYLTFKNEVFDFCIFDVMLPRMDGFTLAEKVRQKDTKIPILFLTAKSMKEDTIKGLQIGADDYMTKPFRMEELLLRIQAILRRTQGDPGSTSPKEHQQIGKFTFEYDQRKLIFQDEEQKLTSKEADLLFLLCQYRNQVLDRSLALKKIWREDTYFNARSMDVYVTKLRKYLRADDKLQIINVHGQGFKLIEL